MSISTLVATGVQSQQLQGEVDSTGNYTPSAFFGAQGPVSSPDADIEQVSDASFLSSESGASNALFTFDIDNNGQYTNLRPVIANSKTQANGSSLGTISLSNGVPNLLLVVHGGGHLGNGDTFSFEGQKLLRNGVEFTGSFNTTHSSTASSTFKFSMEKNGQTRINIEDWKDGDFNDLVIQIDAPRNIATVSPSGTVQDRPVQLSPLKLETPVPFPDSNQVNVQFSSLPPGEYQVANQFIVDTASGEVVGGSDSLPDGLYNKSDEGALYRNYQGQGGNHWFAYDEDSGMFKTGFDLAGAVVDSNDLLQAGLSDSEFSLSYLRLSDVAELLSGQSFQVVNGQLTVNSPEGSKVVGLVGANDGVYQSQSGEIQKQFVVDGQSHWLNADDSGRVIPTDGYTLDSLFRSSGDGGLGLSVNDVSFSYPSESSFEGLTQINIDADGLVRVNGEVVAIEYSLNSGDYLRQGTTTYRQHGDYWVPVNGSIYFSNVQGFKLSPDGLRVDEKTMSYNDLLDMGVDPGSVVKPQVNSSSLPDDTYFYVEASGDVMIGDAFYGQISLFDEGTYYRDSSGSIYKAINENTWGQVDPLLGSFLINKSSWNGEGVGPALGFDDLVNQFGIDVSDLRLDPPSAALIGTGVEFELGEDGLARVNGVVVASGFALESPPGVYKFGDSWDGALKRNHEGQWLDAIIWNGNFEINENQPYSGLLGLGISQEDIEIPNVFLPTFLYQLQVGAFTIAQDGMIWSGGEVVAQTDFPAGQYQTHEGGLYQLYTQTESDHVWLKMNSDGQYEHELAGMTLNEAIGLGVQANQISFQATDEFANVFL